jgi:hypothetical protein
LNEINEVFAIDSMPLEVCKISRMDRSKINKEVPYSSPDKGFCAAQNKWFYGYRLHAACSPSGVIQIMDLTKASGYDLTYLKTVRDEFHDCIIVADRGYMSKDFKEELWRENRVSLEYPYRKGQLAKKPMPYVLRRIRKRIETVFSQLCDQFMIQRNYAKSFAGYRTRILAKISGMTVLQYLNRFVNNVPVGHLKYALR